MVFALAAALLSISTSHAKVRYKIGRFVEDKQNIYVSFSFSELVNTTIKRKLKSGFTQKILLYAGIFDYITRQRKAFTIWTCTATYDLWEDHYIIQTADPHKKTTFKEKTQAKAIGRMVTVDRLPVMTRSQVPAWKYFYVDVLVRYNPVSPKLLRKVRTWLRRPRGGPGGLLSTQSFFGSSLSFFVNPRISPAEKSISFRTQNFYRTSG